MRAIADPGRNVKCPSIRTAGLRAFVALAALLLACSRPPVIDSITANPNPVAQNGKSRLTAVAHSPQGEALFFYWRAESGGTINDTRLDTTTYAAGKLSGLYPISLRVMDSHSRVTADTFYIEVGADRR